MPTKKCPKCFGVVDAAATKCKHCGSNVMSPKDYLIGCAVLIVIILAAYFFIFSGTSEDSGPPQITESNAFIVSKNFITPLLKSPATADFPFLDYSHQKLGDDHWLIQSYVDSQNDFGAMLRTNYSAELKFLGGDWADPASWELVNLEVE